MYGFAALHRDCCFAGWEVAVVGATEVQVRDLHGQSVSAASPETVTWTADMAETTTIP